MNAAQAGYLFGAISGLLVGFIIGWLVWDTDKQHNLGDELSEREMAWIEILRLRAVNNELKARIKKLERRLERILRFARALRLDTPCRNEFGTMGLHVAADDELWAKWLDALAGKE